MTLEDYLARMDRGEPIRPGGEMHAFMREINEETMRLTFELNGHYHTQEEVRAIFSKIIGKPVDKTFRLFPPFYTNCGKNITVGKRVFIKEFRGYRYCDNPEDLERMKGLLYE